MSRLAFHQLLELDPSEPDTLELEIDRHEAPTLRIEIPRAPRLPREASAAGVEWPDELETSRDVADVDLVALEDDGEEDIIDFDEVARNSTLPPRPESGVFVTARAASLVPPTLVPPDLAPGDLTVLEAGPPLRTRLGITAAVLALGCASAAFAYGLGVEHGRAEVTRPGVPVVAAAPATPTPAASVPPVVAAIPRAVARAEAPVAPRPAATAPAGRETPAVDAPTAPRTVTPPPRAAAPAAEPRPRANAALARTGAPASAAPVGDLPPETADSPEPASAEPAARVAVMAQPEAGEALATAEAAPVAQETAGEAVGEPAVASESTPAQAPEATPPETAATSAETEPAAETGEAAPEAEPTAEELATPTRSFADLLPARPAAPRALPVRPSTSDVRRTLGAVASRVRACSDGTASVVTVRVRIAGSGEVLQARPDGALAPATASCIADAVSTARFPEFSGDALTVSYPFRL